MLFRSKGKDSVLKVKDVKGLDDAKEKMKRSQIDGIIELPKDFGEQGPDGKPRGTIKVLYSKGSDQAGSTLTAVMNQTTNCWANWLWEWLMIPTLKFTVWFLKIEPKTKRKISGKRKVKNSDTLSRRKRLWKACTWPRIPVQYLFIVSP